MDGNTIEQVHGDLLAADADALVNAVNTVGVMGKGIALQFRRAYPAMFEAYVQACRAGEVEIGRMHVWPIGRPIGPRYVINFPTKAHWRGASRFEYIDDGLVDLLRVIRELRIASLAVPALGAGNGGLPWPDVRRRIVDVLGNEPGVRVLLHAPAGGTSGHRV